MDPINPPESPGTPDQDPKMRMVIFPVKAPAGQALGWPHDLKVSQFCTHSGYLNGYCLRQERLSCKRPADGSDSILFNLRIDPTPEVTGIS
jgi:hypothetical protein